MNTTATKTATKKAATTTKVVNAPKAATKKAAAAPKVTYLSVGVTGKQLMKSIYAANNAHKKDMGS
jgi:hypothetical protein